VAGMREKTTRVWWGNLKKGDLLDEPGENERTGLKGSEINGRVGVV